MREIVTFKRYQEFILKFKDFDRSISSSNDVRELVQEIQNYLDVHLHPLLEDVLFRQTIRNFKGEMERKDVPVLFLSSPEDLAAQLTDKSFLSKLTQSIRQKISSFLSSVEKMSDQSLELSHLFSHEFTADPYSYNRVISYYYFDRTDKDCVKMYRQIYAGQLVPKLQEFYNRNQIKKLINVDRFTIVSDSDFDKENCLTDVGIKNLTNLVDKLNDIVASGQKLLIDNDIVIVNAAKVVLDLFAMGGLKIANQEKSSTTDPVKREQQKDEDIKRMFVKLLKSASYSKDYIGFFLKEDFLQMGRNKYPEVNHRRLEILLDQVTTPHPPAGILLFNAPTDEGVKTYFIALEMIPQIFEQMNIRDSRTSISVNMDVQHFILFLKKFFQQYQNSDVMRVAKLLNTTPDYVQHMKQIVSRL